MRVLFPSTIFVWGNWSNCSSIARALVICIHISYWRHAPSVSRACHIAPDVVETAGRKLAPIVAVGHPSKQTIVS